VRTAVRSDFSAASASGELELAAKHEVASITKAIMLARFAMKWRPLAGIFGLQRLIQMYSIRGDQSGPDLSDSAI